MDYLTPPDWISNDTLLEQVFEHQVYFPQEALGYTALQDTTLFHAGAKQFLHWKGELTPSILPNSIVFSFLGPQGLKGENVLNVLKSIKPLCNMSTVLEVYRPAHTAFLGITFSSQAEVTKLTKAFRYYNKAIVVYVSHASSCHYEFRLLWLPPMFGAERVHHLMTTYTSSYNIQRESIRIDDAAFSPMNVVRGTLTPKFNSTVKDLPHLIHLPEPHRGCALLVVMGRDPLCLKCKEVGHQRRSCPLQKCTLCHKLHYSTKPCGTTAYADIAGRNVTKLVSEDWSENIDDGSQFAPFSLHPIISTLNGKDVSSSSMMSVQPSGSILVSNPVGPTGSTTSQSVRNMSPVQLSSLSKVGEMIKCGHTSSAEMDPSHDGSAASVVNCSSSVPPSSSSQACTSSLNSSLCEHTSSSTVDTKFIDAHPSKCKNTLPSSLTLNLTDPCASPLLDDPVDAGSSFPDRPFGKKRSRSCSPLGRKYSSSKTYRRRTVALQDHSTLLPDASIEVKDADTIMTDSKSHFISSSLSCSGDLQNSSSLVLRPAMLSYDVHASSVSTDYQLTSTPFDSSVVPTESLLPASLDLHSQATVCTSESSMDDSIITVSKKRKPLSPDDSDSGDSVDRSNSFSLDDPSFKMDSYVSVIEEADALIQLFSSPPPPPYSSCIMDIIDHTGISITLINQIADICPGQKITPSIAKKIILINDFGIHPNEILTKPNILSATVSVITKRLKQLHKRISIPFTIHDLAANMPILSEAEFLSESSRNKTPLPTHNRFSP